jgi:hypothetical protein
MVHGRANHLRLYKIHKQRMLQGKEMADQEMEQKESLAASVLLRGMLC